MPTSRDGSPPIRSDQERNSERICWNSSRKSHANTPWDVIFVGPNQPFKFKFTEMMKVSCDPYSLSLFLILYNLTKLVFKRFEEPTQFAKKYTIHQEFKRKYTIQHLPIATSNLHSLGKSLSEEKFPNDNNHKGSSLRNLLYHCLYEKHVKSEYYQSKMRQFISSHQCQSFQALLHLRATISTTTFESISMSKLWYPRLQHNLSSSTPSTTRLEQWQ